MPSPCTRPRFKQKKKPQRTETSTPPTRMSLPSQRKFNLNANKTNPAALTFDQSSNSWKRQEFEQDPINQLTYRPDATAATNRNKDKGKRPANMNAWSAKCGGDRSTTTTASKSSSSLNPATASSSQLAGPTRERGKIETDPRKVRWPLIGVKR